MILLDIYSIVRPSNSKVAITMSPSLEVWVSLAGLRNADVLLTLDRKGSEVLHVDMRPPPLSLDVGVSRKRGEKLERKIEQVIDWLHHPKVELSWAASGRHDRCTGH